MVRSECRYGRRQLSFVAGYLALVTFGTSSVQGIDQRGSSTSSSLDVPLRPPAPARLQPESLDSHVEGDLEYNEENFPPWSNQEEDRRSNSFSADGRPPPPPPPLGTAYNPIHYKFQSRDAAATKATPEEKTPGDDEYIPITHDAERPLPISEEANFQLPKYASPRRDPVTMYMSTSKGKTMLTLSSGVVGASLGAFVGKSMLGTPRTFAIVSFVVFCFACIALRNAYGELARALGLTLIFAMQRFQRIRKRYPTMRHVKSSIGAGPRMPFPPVVGSGTPWTYQPSPDSDEPDFNMLYSLLAMAFCGSTCGGNMPLIPTWLGALSGALFFAFVTTLPDARGDLARTMGMRCVALMQQVIAINRELQLLPKVGVVSGKILDKMLILDRKHRIKDRIIAALSFLYEQVSRTAAQMQNDVQGRQQDRRAPASSREQRRPMRPPAYDGRGPDEYERTELERQRRYRREEDDLGRDDDDERDWSPSRDERQSRNRPPPRERNPVRDEREPPPKEERRRGLFRR